MPAPVKTRPERKPPPLVFACDRSFAMPLATALRSVVEANPGAWPMEVSVLAHGFPRSLRRHVTDSLPSGGARIRWVDVDLDAFSGFRTNQGVSEATYARLLIPGMFPHSVLRVLYLDADLLVLGDLNWLWEMDLEGAVAGAVLDRLDAKIKRGLPGLEAVPRVSSYFNAGVLLIDLVRWREEKISEKAMEYLTMHPQSPFSDQDALNFACDGLWKNLDARWNFQGHYETDIAQLATEQRPSIIHFATSRKPWDATCGNPNAALFDAYRSRTRFARTPWDKTRDQVSCHWSKFKGALKRWSSIHTVCRRISAD